MPWTWLLLDRYRAGGWFSGKDQNLCASVCNGDALNPYGDLEAVAQSRCALKPGGRLFLRVPSVDAESSQDRLVWNAHRFYGPKRLAQMFAGFEHVQSHGQGSEPHESVIHVLRKPAL